VTPTELAVLIRSHKFRFSSESELCDGLEKVFKAAALTFVREYRMTAADRLDFLVESIAVEVKTKFSSPAVTMQIFRYLQNELITGALLVTSRRKHNLPAQMNGKPIVVEVVGGL
jgi:hypothetical protein